MVRLLRNLPPLESPCVQPERARSAVGTKQRCEMVRWLTGYADMNWKVRRACSKLLAGIILTRTADIDMFYDEVAPALVRRFREREENVKVR